MALSRNFRTTYYKTLGVPVVQHIVDAEASYAALLAEPVVNRAQVAKLAQEIGIPAQYRDVVWQLLSGVLPPHTSIWEFAIHERALMYEDVRDAAQVLQPVVCRVETAAGASIAVVETSVSTSAAAGSSVDSESPCRTRQRAVSTNDCAQLVALHRTYWIDILLRKPLRGMDDALYVERVARAVSEVVGGEMERFWCFAKLLELFHDGLGQFKPAVSLQSFYDADSVGDFEVLFIRIVEALKKD